MRTHDPNAKPPDPPVFMFFNGAGHVIRRRSGAVSAQACDLAPEALRGELARVAAAQKNRPA